MDEEQGLASPLAGSIRGIRRSISSNVLTGGAAAQPQPDPQVTNLLQQNSLQLTNVSTQLANISGQVTGLEASLGGIKENLALSDALDRQREAASQNRERILAEQGLREGKESAIETRIQQALTAPIRKIAEKTQSGLLNLSKFFLYLTGGWLTQTVMNMIDANAEGNVDLMQKLQRTLQRQLLIAGGTILALTLGFKGILRGITFLGTSALRIGKGGFLRRPFASIAANIKSGALLLTAGGLVAAGAAGLSPTGTIAGDAVVGGGLMLAYNPVSKFIKERFSKVVGALDKKFPKKAIAKKVAQETAKNSSKVVKPLVKQGILGFLKQGKNFIGKIGGPLFTFVLTLMSGEGVGTALAAAAGFAAGAKAGAAVGAAIGALFGGIGAVPGGIIGGIIGGFLGESAFKGIFKGIKAMFGFKVGNEQKESQEDEEIGPAVLGAKINESGAFSMPGGSTGTVDSLNEIGRKNRIVIDSLNDNSAAEMITPKSKNKSEVATAISTIEEGAPTIVNLNAGGSNDGSGSAPEAVSSSNKSTNALPNIGFDKTNIHTMYATSQYGANA